jgi:hypothetical protein
MAVSDKAGNLTRRAEVIIEFEQEWDSEVDHVKRERKWHAKTIGDQENPEALKRNVVENTLKGRTEITCRHKTSRTKT